MSFTAATIEAAAEFHAHETDTDTVSDAAWYRYLKACKRALGVQSVDGEEDADGYSLDSAHMSWKAGISAADYAKGKRPKAWHDEVARWNARRPAVMGQ